jgi:hypothetical protein
MEKKATLSGNSTRRGFFVYGDVPTELLAQAASEALDRLQAGEKELAISPYCGTNLVVAATLTGMACAWAMGSERRWSKLPSVISAALLAILASRPLGYQAQKHVTTSGAVGRLSIRDIHHAGAGGMTVHMVRTSSDD